MSRFTAKATMVRYVGTLSLLMAALFSPATADSLVVKTSYGFVRGQNTFTRSNKKVMEFLGVRYAEPPLNNLKFMSPKELKPWKGIKNATKECDFCLQQLTLIQATQLTITGSEDCLCMNIFTPNIKPKSKMPVLFWIHGGAYQGLSALKAYYDHKMMLDQDVVLVTVSYRLGILGFLTAEDDVLPGNLAMKDQAAALRWVKGNIGQFGGDVNSITLWGESSGAGSVHLHMLSPLSHKMFHRGIIHSGSARNLWGVAEPGVLREKSRRVADLIGCPFTPTEAFLTCLQKTPSETIVNTSHTFVEWDIDPAVIFSPVVERPTVKDAFLLRKPVDSSSTKPLLAGYNFGEGGLKYASVTSGDVVAKFRQWNQDFMRLTPISLFYNTTAPNKDEVTRKVRDFYLGKDRKEITPNETAALNMMFGDMWFINGILDAIEGHRGKKYLYHYNYNTSYSVCNNLYNNDVKVGACHLDELMCFFNMNMSAETFYQENHPDYKLSRALVEIWTNFAKSSVPSGAGVKWNPVTTDALEHLEITNQGLTMKKNPIEGRRQFWKTLTIRPPRKEDSIQIFD